MPNQIVLDRLLHSKAVMIEAKQAFQNALLEYHEAGQMNDEADCKSQIAELETQILAM